MHGENQPSEDFLDLAEIRARQIEPIEYSIDANNIILLENGEGIEQGNHKNLFAAKEKYYQMWKKQMPTNKILMI